MINQINTIISETLSECLNHVLKDGYTKHFKVMGMGLWLSSEDDKSDYNPDDVIIPRCYHVNGDGAPLHTEIVYLIETMDGKKGTLVDTCTAHDDLKLSTFIKQVDDMQGETARIGRHHHQYGKSSLWKNLSGGIKKRLASFV